MGKQSTPISMQQFSKSPSNITLTKTRWSTKKDVIPLLLCQSCVRSHKTQKINKFEHFLLLGINKKLYLCFNAFEGNYQIFFFFFLHHCTPSPHQDWFQPKWTGPITHNEDVPLVKPSVHITHDMLLTLKTDLHIGVKLMLIIFHFWKIML